MHILFDASLHFHFSHGWQGYPVNAIPSIVRDYRIIAEHADGPATTLADVRGSHLRNRRHPATLGNVSRIRVEVLGTNSLPRAQIYVVRVLGRQAFAPRRLYPRSGSPTRASAHRP